MNKNHTIAPALFRAGFLLAALACVVPLRGQSQGTLIVTDEVRQKELAKIQDRVLERRYKVEQLHIAGSPADKAKAVTRDMLGALQNQDLEGAARRYYEGVEAGVPQLMEQTAKSLEEAAREAAKDASSVVRWTSGSAKRPQLPNQSVAGGLIGSAAGEADDVMAEVEADRATLQQDLDNYVGQVTDMFPELKMRMVEAGLTPAAVRDIAKKSMTEADQLKYRAALFRINAIIWQHTPTIIRTRALNNGKGQPLIGGSAKEAIESAQSDKLAL